MIVRAEGWRRERRGCAAARQTGGGVGKRGMEGETTHGDPEGERERERERSIEGEGWRYVIERDQE